MAYSSGFNPHPRISYAGASPTGAASEAEYLEIGLSEVVEPDDVLRSLSEALPDGLDLLEVVVAEGGSLADRLVASRWMLAVDLPAATAERAVAEFLAVESVAVERMTKKGPRTFDCRAAVVSLTAHETPTGTALDLTLRHTVPAVRPDDVLTGLAKVAGFRPATPPLLSRLRQGPLDEATGEVGDPLA